MDKGQLRQTFEKILSNQASANDQQISELAKNLCELCSPQEIAQMLGDSMRNAQDLHKNWGEALKKSRFDPLTGIANRAGFSEKLNKELESFHRGASHNAAIIYIDLDEFKPINDTHGHDAGDEALKLFANVLKNFSRQNETPARMGGDEFALLIIDESGEQQDFVSGAIERLSQEMDNLFLNYEQTTIKLKASIGGMIIDPDLSISENIKKADESMFTAKRAGKEADSANAASTPQPV